MLNLGNHDVPKFMPIILVYGIIIFEFVIFTVLFLPAYQTKYGLITIVIAIEFTIFYILLHISYYQCQKVSPGSLSNSLAKHYNTNTLEEIKTRTKKNNNILQNLRKKSMLKGKQSQGKYKSNIELAEEQYEEDEENFDILECLSLVSYCFKCKNIKLPRAHHCKECNKCVLRMDHHCPWVNNCIGLKNHKFFCQFNFYALMCMIQCTYFIGADYLFYGGTVIETLSPNNRLLVGICGTTCFALDLALGFLLGFHVWHISRNITTVEFHIKEIYLNNPFSKPTKVENLQEIFGEEVKYWFFPFPETYKREIPRSELFEV